MMTLFIRLSCSLLLLSAFSTALYGGDNPPARTVTTSGQGKVSTVADMAEVTMQTTATQKSATEAKQEVDKHINTFLDRLSKLGIDKDSIVASSLRLAPEYEYSNRTRLFAGYSASRDITVTIQKLDNLNQLLEAATESGITLIQQIALKSSKEKTLQSEAFDNAIADSKEKASRLARAYGAELGAIYSINYQSQQQLFAPKTEMAAMRLAADNSGGQYLHDEITFTDQVDIVYELIIPR